MATEDVKNYREEKRWWVSHGLLQGKLWNSKTSPHHVAMLLWGIPLGCWHQPALVYNQPAWGQDGPTSTDAAGATWNYILESHFGCHLQLLTAKCEIWQAGLCTTWVCLETSGCLLLPTCAYNLHTCAYYYLHVPTMCLQCVYNVPTMCLHVPTTVYMCLLVITT